MMASRSSLTDRGQPPAKATALYARASATFDAKLAQTQALLRQAAALGADAVTQASSLGAEDVVITHLINALQLDIPIFVLETGALHTETLALLERTQAGSRAPVTPYRPETGAVMHFIRSHGQDAMYRSMALRKSCCGIRKLEPLARALAGKSAWITGLRREQSGARADMPLIDLSEVAADGVDGADGADSAAGTAGAAGAGGHRGSAGLTKFIPLAHWTWGDLWHYIATHGVDYNPLHDRFYPSIGCAPCTRAISLGEDLRSGRWWWEQESAKECGLHAKPDTPTVTRQKALP